MTGEGAPDGGTAIARSYPAAAHLVLFASIIALPLLLLLGLLLYRSIALEHEQLQLRIVQVLDDLIADIDRDIDRHLTVLQTLATSRALSDRDWPAFYEQAKASLQGKGYIVLLDAAGRQVVNTFVPYGEAPPFTGDPATIQAMQRKMGPVVSDLFTSLVVKQPVYNISVPVFVDDELRYVMSLGLRPGDVQKLLASQSLGPNWTTMIADGNGAILARSRDHERLVGTAVPRRLRDPEHFRQVHATTSIDGDEVLHSAGRTALGAWIASVNFPVSLVRRQIVTSLWLWGATIVVVSVLVVALAFVFGRRLTTPLAAATAAAHALGRGEKVETRRSRVVEVNAVIEALANAQRDIERNSAALRRSEQQLRTAAEAAQFGAHEYDVVNGVSVRSPQLRRILGVDETETPPTFEEGLALVHPDDREATRRRKQLVISGAQDRYQLEYRIRRPDGRVRWVMDRGQVMRDAASGKVVRVVGVLLDITELKESEQRQQLLFDELNHRVKNTLAIVQSLAQQTLRSRSDPKEFVAAFEERISSLARAHDLLTRESWTGASLGDVVGTAMAPFTDEKRKILIAGEPVIIPASATITLSLMLHELAANAAKYGALATADGLVSIEWNAVPKGAVIAIDLRWREENGPIVKKPARVGFGSRLLAASARQLGAELDLDYAPDGLRCRLRFAVPGS
jgi:PAS domain S-box-containing protein